MLPEELLEVYGGWGGAPSVDDDDEPDADAGPPAPCVAVDPMSEAVCTRGSHRDRVHRYEDLDFTIQWTEMPRLEVPSS